MTTPTDSDIIPDTSFDPIVFWLQHKTRIIIYAAVVLVGVAGVLLYQLNTRQKLAESQRMFALAHTEDDYRLIIQKFPNTIVAGNSILLLSEKLRDAKKYDEAITALQSMIDQYPTYPMIDAAWLALGATYSAEGKVNDALSTYQVVTTKFANNYSAPQAMLEIALILKGKGKLDEAKQTYENVKSQYPNSYFASEAMKEMLLLHK
jgi:tetratricopeptide (TPR) repeat protein